MSELSVFKSRQGNIPCTSAEFYDFVTDIRNFKQFLPADIKVNDLHIEKDSCSFNVPSMGNVNFSLSAMEPCNKVVYSGTVFQSNSFDLLIEIRENIQNRAQVQLNLQAILNPLLKMVAAKPIDSLLEKIITEMERFRGWNQRNQ